MESSIQSHWQDYYVIIGTAAGALTGLMFVVITLIAGFRQPSTRSEGIAIFSTPTLIHFITVLIISALLSVPWPQLWDASFLFLPIGLAGMVYMAFNAYRMRQMHDYQPVLEDWMLYFVLPLVGYIGLFVAALMLRNTPDAAFFVFGGIALLFLIIAIYSAWELVTYMVTVNEDESQQDSAAQATETSHSDG
jgi:glucan phosphoethanolaminetransferase (alkaline phosphatase superfamily)